jgi:hypothetical protein
VVVTGANAYEFAVSGLTLPATLNPGQGIGFTVDFSPYADGVSVATLQISDNDPRNNPFTVALTGTGVDAPPTVVLTAPANGAKFAAPVNLTLSAGASDVYGAITNVAFYAGTNLLWNATNAPYTMTTANLFAGSYALTAVATDDSGAVANSSVVNVTITNAVPTVMGGQMTGGANGFKLTISGHAGQTYEVLASDDLTVPQSAWTVVGTGTFGSTNAIFTDNGTTNHLHRYYVVKSP